MQFVRSQISRVAYLSKTFVYDVRLPRHVSEFSCSRTCTSTCTTPPAATQTASGLRAALLRTAFPVHTFIMHAIIA